MNEKTKALLLEIKGIKDRSSNPAIDSFLKIVVFCGVGVMASDGEIEAPEYEMYKLASQIVELDPLPLPELRHVASQSTLIEMSRVPLLKALMDTVGDLQVVKALTELAVGYLAAVSLADNEMEHEELEFIKPFLEIYNMLKEV